MPKKKANISGMPKRLSETITGRLEKTKGENTRVLPFQDKKIGISVSDTDEYEQLGFSETHQKDITIELTRYLFVNGADLVYGGDLREQGYTYAFSEISFLYRQKEDHDKTHYDNYLAWPIYNKLEKSDEAALKRSRVKIIRTDPPKGIPKDLLNTKDISTNINGKSWMAGSLSIMRAGMMKGTDARVFIGGKLSSYKGFYPGIIEEAYLALKAKQPLFLAGAFGGATQLLIRAINGEKGKTLETEVFDWHPGLADLYQHAGKPTPSLQAIFAEFGKLGVSGLSRLNKLSASENNLLFNTLHFPEMIYLILAGLKKRFGNKR